MTKLENFLARLPVVRQIVSQPLVTATGIAAFIHSAWTLNTFFDGIEPTQFTWQWLAWLLPGALMAFAADIGQIITSAELRAGERTKAKYAVFGVFAGFTYFLQFNYMIEHIPALTIAAGVRAEWVGLVTLIRDSAIFFVPALLPLSTLLYTFSYGKPKKPVTAERAKPVPSPEMSLVAVAKVDGKEIAVGTTNMPTQIERARAMYAKRQDLNAKDQHGKYVYSTRYLQDNVPDSFGTINRNSWNEARKP